MLILLYDPNVWLPQRNIGRAIFVPILLFNYHFKMKRIFTAIPHVVLYCLSCFL
jgi:hypothetical protein